MQEDPKKAGKALYSDYLQLEKILSAQQLKSAQQGDPIHEELFFIIAHQVYELWFKQILADLDSVINILQTPYNQQDKELIIIRLQRIQKIIELLINQLTVLETMTPLQFINFRRYLGTMSGFQSFQFRMIEAKFGLKKEQRLDYTQETYTADFESIQKQQLKSAEEGPSLFDAVNQWLEQLPFLRREDYDFVKEYQQAVSSMLVSEKKRVEQNPNLSTEEKGIIYGRIDQLLPIYNTVFQQESYERLIQLGERRLSYKAFVAALFIRLYHHYEFLQLPDLVLTQIVEVNHTLSNWRYRHSQMVQKMIGWSMGTGGSKGVRYLLETVEKYDIFSDLYSIPMLLIPETYLPELN